MAAVGLEAGGAGQHRPTVTQGDVPCSDRNHLAMKETLSDVSLPKHFGLLRTFMQLKSNKTD